MQETGLQLTEKLYAVVQIATILLGNTPYSYSLNMNNKHILNS